MTTHTHCITSLLHFNFHFLNRPCSETDSYAIVSGQSITEQTPGLWLAERPGPWKTWKLSNDDRVFDVRLCRVFILNTLFDLEGNGNIRYKNNYLIHKIFYYIQFDYILFEENWKYLEHSLWQEKHWVKMIILYTKYWHTILFHHLFITFNIFVTLWLINASYKLNIIENNQLPLYLSTNRRCYIYWQKNEKLCM